MIYIRFRNFEEAWSGCLPCVVVWLPQYCQSTACLPLKREGFGGGRVDMEVGL